MFLSTSHNKIDLKCRVSIPASFRVNLEKSNLSLRIHCRKLNLQKLVLIDLKPFPSKKFCKGFWLKG